MPKRAHCRCGTKHKKTSLPSRPLEIEPRGHLLGRESDSNSRRGARIGSISEQVTITAETLLIERQTRTVAVSSMYVKDATLPSIDWSAPIVKGHATCAARWNDNGTIIWLVMPRFGPARSHSPLRDGRIRLHTVPSADVSLNKITQINERLRLQFRVEAFNVTNRYVHNRQGFNTNPESSGFGTLTRATVASTNSNLPENTAWN